MIKAVLFDLDGTLANSLADLADSTNYALEEMGFATHETEKFKYMVGDGIPKLIERALPQEEATKENILCCFELFMNRYRDHYYDKTVSYAGITELLEALKGLDIKIAVISNKAQEMAEKVVAKLFGSSFDAVAGKQEGYPAKPDPALTLKIMGDLGVMPNECAFVGDSGMDMAAAVNSGTLPIGVLWGFRTEEELKQNGAAFTVSEPREILEIVKGKNDV